MRLSAGHARRLPGSGKGFKCGRLPPHCHAYHRHCGSQWPLQKVFWGMTDAQGTWLAQTKETLTLRIASFGSKCDVSDAKFLKKLDACGITDLVNAFATFKNEKELKKTDGAKRQRITGADALSKFCMTGPGLLLPMCMVPSLTGFAHKYQNYRHVQCILAPAVCFSICAVQTVALTSD